MIRTIFADKDATIYKDIPTLNSGLDEILELRSSFYKINQYTIAETSTGTKSLSRILIKFDITDVSTSISNGKIVNPKFYLKLNTTEAHSISTNYVIEAWAVSQSWDMGMGKKLSNPIISNGVSWYTKTASSSSVWSGSLPASGLSSITAQSASIQGGTWNANYYASQSFNYETTDIEMDVTSIVNAWTGSSIPNEGFILKFPNSYETGSNTTEYGSINFFSRDTNTIYSPTLQVRWDDSTFVTGSLTIVDINSMNISVNGLKDRYKLDEIARVNLHVRDRFPAKTFVTSSRNLTSKFIPSCSYYSIKDAHTEETIVSFDSGSTKISCNSSGNYFNFDMRGLQPERYYKFVLKIQDSRDNPTNVAIIDNKFYFKVER